MDENPGQKGAAGEGVDAPIECAATVVSSEPESVTAEAAAAAAAAAGGTRNFLHPLSGLAILGLDWILFSENIIAPGVAMGVNVLLGFLLGGMGTVFCQRRFGNDGRARSLVKGIIGGILVGIPTPIVGTLVGTTILGLCGLGAMKDKALADAAKTVLPKSDPDSEQS